MMASDQPPTAREPRLRVRIDVAPTLRARAIWAAEALLARAGVAHWELVDSASDVDLAFPHDPAQWSFTWDRAPNADADPLAFTFWWLARVEERLAPEECFDEHGRFRYERSALARGGDPFATPVDDVAAHLVVGPWVQGAATDSWSIVATHDIDLPWRWTRAGERRAARRIRDELRAGRFGAAFATGCALAAAPIWRLLRDDPWSNATRIRRFEWARGARSTSYVLMAGNVPEDGAADMHERGRERYVRRLVAGTRRRRAAGGGLIGLHGSFVSSVTPGRIAEERADLVKLVGDGIGDHRFHYLRHRPDRAWPELAAAGLTSDASLGYAEHPGFRAGTAHPFRAWHHEEDHVLDLVVLPLAFMDASLDARYLDLGPTGSGEALALRALERIREVGGSASVLFHNDRLCCVDSRPWTRLYGRLLDTTRAGGGTACTAHDAATRYRATLPPWLLA